MLHDVGFTQFGKKSFVCTILGGLQYWSIEK